MDSFDQVTDRLFRDVDAIDYFDESVLFLGKRLLQCGNIFRCASEEHWLSQCAVAGAPPDI